MKRVSWRQAAVSGLLFALISCGWEYFRRSPDLDELAYRFAFLFVFFTVFYRAGMNWIARRDREIPR